VLQHTRGRISGEAGAAQILGMHPNNLRSRMSKLPVLSPWPLSITVDMRLSIAGLAALWSLLAR